MRRSDGFAVALLLALLIVLLAAGSEVSAHAYLEGSTPEDGAKLPSAPTSVTLRYTEPVIPESVWIQMKRADLTETAGDEADISLDAPEFPDEDGKRVIQPLSSDLGLGAYTLQWAVTSSVDGHPSLGVVTFEVTGFVSSGTATGEGGGPATTVRWADLPALLVRWMSYAGVLAFVGMSALAWRLGATSNDVRGEAIHSGRLQATALAYGLRRRGRWLGAVSLVVGAIGWLGNLSVNANLSLLSVAALRHSPFQLIAVIMTAALLGTALLFFWLERPHDRSARAGGSTEHAGDGRTPELQHGNEGAPKPLRMAPAWTVAGTLLLLGFSLGGHAAAIQGPRVSAVLMDWMHLGAAATWLGGMAYLLLAVFPAAKAAGAGGFRASQPSRAAADRFTVIALVSIGILIVTGVFSSELRFASLGDIPQSLYGRSLIVKLSAFALMGVAAWTHHQLLRPRLRRARDAAASTWRASIAVEAFLGLVVLAAVAVMVTYPVPQRAATRALNEIPDQTGRALTLAEDADRLLLTATGFPLQPGHNLFRVRVENPFNLSLKPEQVDLRLTLQAIPDEEIALGGAPNDALGDPSAGGVEGEPSARTLRAVRQDDGSFLARAELPANGMWRLTARVRTPEVDWTETSFLFPVPIPEAKLLMNRAADVMEGITDFKIRERLSDGRTTLHNVYELSSQKHMAYHVENGLEILFTEHTRYTKPPGQGWTTTPAPEQRLGLIGYLRDAQDVHAVREVEVNGTPTFEIHFYDERISARMAVWVATETYRPVKLKMMYPGHYMTWEFYDMGVPNRIEAPI